MEEEDGGGAPEATMCEKLNSRRFVYQRSFRVKQTCSCRWCIPSISFVGVRKDAHLTAAAACDNHLHIPHNFHHKFLLIAFHFRHVFILSSFLSI
jgi:hypothetical protein